MALSQKLKELRKEKRFTQIELANKAGIGVNSVARYEKGERTPDIVIFLQVNNVRFMSFLMMDMVMR